MVHGRLPCRTRCFLPRGGGQNHC